MYFPEDLLFAVRDHLLHLTTTDEASIQVIRRAPSECAPGKIRWAIEIEEPDRRSKSIPDRHPRVLQVYDECLQELYGICLEQAGCEVESTSNNDAAMRLYCEHGPYDVVLADMYHFLDLFSRIRERNPEQAIAFVGACGALGIRSHYKIPVLRTFRRQQLVRLVESAIKPEVRILLVAGGFGEDLWRVVDSHPTSFEIELEPNGDEALKRYRERGPYDLVLTGFRHPGMDGSDLALAIRKENPTQRIALIMEKSSPAMRRSIQQKLGDIPVLQLESVCSTRDELWEQKMRRAADGLSEGEGQEWLDLVEATIAHKRTAKKPRTARSTRRNRATDHDAKRRRG